MGIFANRVRRWRAAREREQVDWNRLKAGATFARMSAQHVVETARILSIEDHESGIPHVRYNCRLHRASTIFDDGPRTLALPTFLERFESRA
ncbi:MAG: hypothetical protein ACE5GS_10295 [Kiloniellaceae bacterium]